MLTQPLPQDIRERAELLARVSAEVTLTAMEMQADANLTAEMAGSCRFALGSRVLEVISWPDRRQYQMLTDAEWPEHRGEFRCSREHAFDVLTLHKLSQVTA